MVPVDPALIAPASPAPTPTDAARGLIEEQMAVLSQLARIGMEIAEECGRQAKAEPASAHNVGLTFTRVARAVRMTIALQSRLAKDLAALDRAAANAERARKDDRRMRLRVLVGRAVSAGIDPDDARDEDAIEDEIEQLSDEAYERLTDAEDGNFWGRPFDEVVAAICKDLGLPPAWAERVHAAVEPPGEPLGMRPRPAPYPPPDAIWPSPPPSLPVPLPPCGGFDAEEASMRGPPS